MNGQSDSLLALKCFLRTWELLQKTKPTAYLIKYLVCDELVPYAGIDILVSVMC